MKNHTSNEGDESQDCVCKEFVTKREDNQKEQKFEYEISPRRMIQK